MSRRDPIPLVDLRAQYAEVSPMLEPDLRRLMADASYIGGEEVCAFENEYAHFVSTAHCIGVGNGTDALELSLRAVGVEAGDEVVLPANTFVATAEAVVRIGAVPVLVDVAPDTLLIDPTLMGGVLTRRTRAVVPVHLYGQVAPMERLHELLRGTRVALVEDAAQAQGASRRGVPAGSLGHVAATSFYPGKNLGAAGDAGAVTTSDPQVAERVRLLANHGGLRKYEHKVVGWNSRLDAVQAVVLRHKLRRLSQWNEQRRALAGRYSERLSGVHGVTLPVWDPEGVHVWHLYVVQVPERDRVLDSLHREGIGAGVHYPVPIHLTGAFRYLGYERGAFPVAEQAARHMLSLPLYPHLSYEQQDIVIDVLERVLAGELVAS